MINNGKLQEELTVHLRTLYTKHLPLVMINVVVVDVSLGSTTLCSMIMSRVVVELGLVSLNKPLTEAYLRLR